MLTLYRGTRIERLSARLALLMKEDPIGNPFIPEVIGVQNHGMARWLSMELARSLQIAGNLDFQFPAEVVWRIYRSVDDSIPDQLPSDREPMKWTIYSVLRDLTDREPFGFLHRYTRPEGGSFNAKKGRELADTVADLFDEYIVYRPDMITKWEEGDLVSGDPTEEWQMQLWNRLKERWSGAHEGFELEDLVAIHRRCMEALRNGEMELDRLPDRLTLFGITTMPASFVELFVELSALIDIHWFWMDPVDETLREDLKEEAGAPGFLSVYAAEGIEFYTMLEQAVRQLEAEIDIVKVEDAPDEPDTFLGAVRDRILHPADGAADEGMEDAELQKDGSFRIHSCHSAVREVEVLHDQLLGMLEEDPGLHPDEILVMVPELNDYAAAIDSVFGAGEKELPDIPYHIIHDMPLKRDPVFIGLSKLLRLLESRFKVTDVFDLLWMEPVRKAYDIGVDQLNTLQRWVQQTRIRWGLDARDKLRSDLPPTDQNTFASGLNQLLLGFAVHADEELYKGIYPYDEIETFDDADLLGRFASFVEDLREARDQVIDSYTPGEWGQILKRWVNTFFAGDERFMQSAGRIHDLLDDAVQSMIFGGWNEDLPFAAWTDELESSLEKAQTGGGYFGQGVTFCGLNPMRNIPHKVIAFLGMNSGAFPHSDIISEFDLIRKNPRPGDRIKRKDHRQLFLESMMSARDTFYLSYTGRSNRDDKNRPPSVVLTELIDLMQTHFGIEDKMIVQSHRLHAYSPVYFDKDSEKFSYSRSNAEVSRNYLEDNGKDYDFLSSVLTQPDDAYRSVTISELVNFFRHPARYLLQERLGIYFDKQDILEEEREPFVYQGLTRYKMENKLLNRLIHREQIEPLREIAQHTGELPAGFPGDYFFEELQHRIEPFTDHIEERIGTDGLTELELDLEIGEFSVNGTVGDLSEGVHLSYRYGTRNSKDLISAWIRHLLLQEHGRGVTTLLLTRDKDTGEPVETYFKPVDKSSEILHTLLGIYWKGLQKKIPLFPETSWSYAYKLLEKGSKEAYALKKASEKWYSEYNDYPQESLDSYNRTLYREVNPLELAEFQELSVALFKPLIQHKKDG